MPWNVEDIPIGPGLVRKHGRLDVNLADPRRTDDSVAASVPHGATHGVTGSDPVTIGQSQVTNLVSDLAALQAAPPNHASRHGAAGADPITIAQSQVTNLTSDLDAKVGMTLIDAKGDLLVGTGSDTLTRVGVGADGYVLTADSTQPAGVKWDAGGGGGGGGGGLPSQTGNAGKFLSTDGSSASWESISSTTAALAGGTIFLFLNYV